MRDENRTAEEPALDAPPPPPTSAIVLLWTAGRATCRAFPITPAAAPLVFGRAGDVLRLDDPIASSRHVEIARRDGAWALRDLGSTNGTFVDGARLAPEAGKRVGPARVVRLGGTILLLVDDASRFAGPGGGREDLEDGGYIVGPALQRVKAATLDAAERGKTLLVTGESGTGKERVAEWYHHKGPRVRGELITLNCATLQKELAEGLLFGTEKGAHSGAHTATRGHLREAHGGVLFLDEVAELALEVQAKLLRAIETKTVLPLGASSPRPADVAYVSATNVDIRAAVAAGRFRHDLHPRLGQQELHLPPLRERPEEIPFLVQLELAREAGAPAPTARLIEACLLRSWRLNVRELFIAIDRAAAAAREAGARELTPERLPEPLAAEPAARPGEAAPTGTAPATGAASAANLGAVGADGGTLDDRKRAEIVAAYRANGFDASKTARALGVGRSTFYRWLEKYGLK
jgi:DNA-binding NtrC family response regulator